MFRESILGGQIEFDIISDDKKILDFMAEYVAPFFIKGVKGENTKVLIEIITKNNQYKKILESLQKYSSIGDKRIFINQKVKKYHIGMSNVYLYDNYKHVVWQEGLSVKIFLNVRDKNSKYVPMRIIREIVCTDRVYRNYYELHAATVEYKNIGISICGKCGAGKTSLTLKLLSTGACYVSNDRTFIKTGNTLRGKGLPTSVHIYQDSVKYIPVINILFVENASHYQHIQWDKYKKGKRTFAINDLKKIENFNIKDEVEVQVILFPSLSEYKANCILEEISKEEAQRNLIQQIRYDEYQNWLDILKLSYGYEYKSKEKYYKDAIDAIDNIRKIRFFKVNLQNDYDEIIKALDEALIEDE